jgi:hypothetical protein
MRDERVHRAVGSLNVQLAVDHAAPLADAIETRATTR